MVNLSEKNINNKHNFRHMENLSQTITSLLQGFYSITTHTVTEIFLTNILNHFLNYNAVKTTEVQCALFFRGPPPPLRLVSQMRKSLHSLSNGTLQRHFWLILHVILCSLATVVVVSACQGHFHGCECGTYCDDGSQ